MFTKFSSILKDSSLLSPVGTIQSSVYITNAWNDVKGIDSEVRKNVKIRMIKGEVLHLSTNNGIWAQEIQLRKDLIIKKMNVILKRNNAPTLLKEIVIYVGNK